MRAGCVRELTGGVSGVPSSTHIILWLLEMSELAVGFRHHWSEVVGCSLMVVLILCRLRHVLHHGCAVRLACLTGSKLRRQAVFVLLVRGLELISVRSGVMRIASLGRWHWITRQDVLDFVSQEAHEPALFAATLRLFALSLVHTVRLFTIAVFRVARILLLPRSIIMHLRSRWIVRMSLLRIIEIDIVLLMALGLLASDVAVREHGSTVGGTSGRVEGLLLSVNIV